MATSIFFNLIDSESNLLTGSKVTLRPYNPPYFTSGSNAQLTYGGPIINYTDSTGYVEFDNVVQGVYKVSVTNANANNPALNGNLQNFAATVFYIQLPDTTGSLINGAAYLITNVENTNSASFAYPASITDYKYAWSLDGSHTASYAYTASNAISASWASNAVSSSWANNARYLLTRCGNSRSRKGMNCFMAEGVRNRTLA